MRTLIFWIAALGCVGITPAIFAQQVHLQFDEVDFQSVDGLAVSGVTFKYVEKGNPSTEAFYASYGPGVLNFLSDPSLTGNADGVLTLKFAAPTSVVEFGLALSTASPLKPGALITLKDAGGSLLEARPLDTVAKDALSFSEGLFQYQGPAVSEVEIDLQLDQGSFALDNLIYNVPECGTGWVWLAFCGWYARRWHASVGMPC